MLKRKMRVGGTPYYVAPERLNNEREDFRSDIYSLGATLFHAVAGQSPFEGETNSASALRDLKEQPLALGVAAPELGRKTVRVIDRMVAPDPQRRFASYDELIDELERARAALDPAARKAKRLPQITVAVVLLILLAGGALYFYKHRAAMNALQSAKDDNATLQHLYEDARRELIAGKYDSARSAFTRLAGEAQNKQPLLNWIRLHRGLAALLRGYTTQARQAFEELEKAGPFSAKAEDAALARFFVETAHTLTSPDSVAAGATGVPDSKGPQALAIFLFAIKDWQQSDFTNSGALLEQFGATECAGSYRGWQRYGARTTRPKGPWLQSHCVSA